MRHCAALWDWVASVEPHVHSTDTCTEQQVLMERETKMGLFCLVSTSDVRKVDVVFLLTGEKHQKTKNSVSVSG